MHRRPRADLGEMLVTFLAAGLVVCALWWVCAKPIPVRPALDTVVAMGECPAP